MDRHNIPTAKYKTFGDLDMAQAYVHEHGAPIVIKADGLAAGKGVTVAMDEHTAQRALEDIFIDHRFGSAGAKVVIEDFLDGQEFSLMSFVNGTDFWPMPISQDHKRAHDGDEGPNTGGMGAYSPVPQIPQSIASNGYPENVIKGARVPEIEVDEDSHVYYAGVASDDKGGLIANSGRVLLVETSAPDIKSAQDKVYAIIDKLELRGLFYRHDIGFKALK